MSESAWSRDYWLRLLYFAMDAPSVAAALTDPSAWRLAGEGGANIVFALRGAIGAVLRLNKPFLSSPEAQPAAERHRLCARAAPAAGAARSVACSQMPSALRSLPTSCGLSLGQRSSMSA